MTTIKQRLTRLESQAGSGAKTLLIVYDGETYDNSYRRAQTLGEWEAEAARRGCELAILESLKGATADYLTYKKGGRMVRERIEGTFDFSGFSDAELLAIATGGLDDND